MSLIRHTIATLGGNPRVVVMPAGTDNDMGYISGPLLSSLVCPRGEGLVVIYADDTSFPGLTGRDHYDIAVIKGGRITRYGPLFLSTMHDQKDNERRVSKYGSKTLVFHRMSNATLRGGATRLGDSHKRIRKEMMKNEPDAQKLFRQITSGNLK